MQHHSRNNALIHLSDHTHTLGHSPGHVQPILEPNLGLLSNFTSYKRIHSLPCYIPLSLLPFLHINILPLSSLTAPPPPTPGALSRPPTMEPSLLLELSIQTLRLLSKSLLFLSDLSTHPLFSVAATSSLLALLYLPRPLLPLLLSPAFLSSLLLVSTLLSLRPPPSPPPAVSPPRPIPQSPAVDDPIPLPPRPDTKPESAPDFAGFRQKVAFGDSFVEWSRRGGPLEVIYEEYEGEEDDDGGDSPEYSRSPEYSYPGRGGLGSLGLCFTDSSDDDSDDNSSVAEDWDSPENIFSRWDEEGDGMIEIALEEDNMIEIDISACR